MENLVIFYDHLVYFRDIGNILWPFGIFCGYLVIFPRFGILNQEKSGNPDPRLSKQVKTTGDLRLALGSGLREG
jgi:hypothetical protein